METLTRRSIHQLMSDAFNQDCLGLFKDLSIDSLIQRILYIAATWTNSCYCVCGLLSSKGHFSSYQSYGFTPSESRLLNIGDKDALLSLPSEEPIRTESIDECENYRIFNIENPAEEIFIPRVYSILFVPIFYNDEVIGTITLINKIGSVNFSAEDTKLIETLSAYAGIAINNARLYTESAIREKRLSKSIDDLALLNELGRLFTDNDGDVSHMLDGMLDLIIGCLGLETAEVFLNSDENPDEYNLILHKGYDASGSLLGLNTITAGEGLLGKCVSKNEIYQLKPEDLDAINERDVVRTKLNYMVVLPLPTKSGVLGLMIFGGRYTKGEEEPDLTLISSIAGWIAPLVENLRLVRQKQRIAVLEDRERIGMDLHDGVIQSIYGVGLMLENARLTAEQNPAKTADSIHLATEALNATIRDIRSYIMNLKPDKLTHENLIQSMKRLANDFHANTLVPTKFITKVEHVEALDEDQNNTFYMICKEALSNIAKHAHAKSVTVNFSEMKDRFVLLIQDDGAGFDTSKKRKNTSHGVSNMFTRTRGLGGDMDITSYPGKGTTVIAWLPLKKSEEES